MTLTNLTIGFALTGSFCTFSKIIPEIENLVGEGTNVVPIISKNVGSFDTRFGKSKDFIEQIETICKRKIISSIIEAEPIGPKNMLNALIVAPCTGNTLSKISNGITDTAVTMAAKATLRNLHPVILAVSTNDGLSTSAKNLGILLNTKNIYMVPFGQDDPKNKQTSLVAQMDLVIPTLKEALDGKQIQPILL